MISGSGLPSADGTLRPIVDVASELDVSENDLELYGRHKAKLSFAAIEQIRARPPGKLIVVTAMTPTPAGEGKTTVAIGLAMALRRLGKTSCACLREPSLGPLFGMKGGATGGGRATLEPAADLNLHFTGDLHAVTAAQNLLVALVDNHLFHGNALGIDPTTAPSRRCLDVCDRSLRESFELTAASEVMATLLFANDLADLKARLGRIIVGYTTDGRPVTVADLKAAGALTAILRDAAKPNLVQTSEGTPALVHLGPFGNIACGCNSVLATSLSRRVAEYTITEAGFASDLGFEKFCDLICPAGGFAPDAVVLVATVRALKYHGGVPADRLRDRDGGAVIAGFANLAKHIENVAAYGLPCVVALNRFTDDDPAELETVRRLCEGHAVPCVTTSVWESGGEGGRALGEAVVAAAERPNAFRPVVAGNLSLEEKLETMARTLYGADGVRLLPSAEETLARLRALGVDRLPLCVAKTHLSLSDDPKQLGRPSRFTVAIRDFRVMAGAGYIVCYAGKILTMPGLPKTPAAERIDVTPDGRIVGLT